MLQETTLPYNFRAPFQVQFETKSPGKERATLIFVNYIGGVEGYSALVVDRAQDGFRLSVGSGRQQAQLVDLVLEEGPSKSVRCSVAWIGDSRSKHERQARLETVELLRSSSNDF